MTKWADYLISEVQYNPEHTHILNVKRHLDIDTGIARPNIVNRMIVEHDLKLGKIYKTIFKNKQDQWIQGDDVRIIQDSGFITTDPNCTTRDNLGNLPEF